VGEQAFTIGSPMGREGYSLAASSARWSRHFSDITINPGSLGGPLFNLLGEVIGITGAQIHLLASLTPIDNARPVFEQVLGKLLGASPSMWKC